MRPATVHREKLPAFKEWGKHRRRKRKWHFCNKCNEHNESLGIQVISNNFRSAKQPAAASQKPGEICLVSSQHCRVEIQINSFHSVGLSLVLVWNAGFRRDVLQRMWAVWRMCDSFSCMIGGQRKNTYQCRLMDLVFLTRALKNSSRFNRCLQDNESSH